jgi:hypothetical protein
MQTSGSTLIARILPRPVRRMITLVYAAIWVATIYALVRGHYEPRWLELLAVVTFGLYIVIDRLGRWAEEQTEPEDN